MDEKSNSLLDEESAMSGVKLTRSEMENAVVTKLRSSLDQLEEIWSNIGFPEHNCQKRNQIIVYHVQVLFDQLVREEDGMMKRLISSLESYSVEITELCEQLDIELFTPEEGLPLLEMEKVLRGKADELEKQKHSRLKALQELQDQEKSLCILLDMMAYSVARPVPTQEQLKELAQHVAMLQDEQRRRLHKFQGMKVDIIEAMERLEHTPASALEKEVAYAKDEDVLLSEENLINVRTLCDQLKQMCSSSERQAQRQREKLVTLYNCLKVDRDERESFLAKHSGYRKSVLESLNAEIQRCEEIKRCNMETFVANAREHLTNLWSKCYASNEQKEQFAAFNDDNYTEELLSLHEREVSRWESCWEKYKKLFSGIEELKKLWAEVRSFEKKSSDPNRFNNRGGKLLQEEKQRKKLIISLPVLQDKLLLLANEWEVENGEQFLVGGNTLKDFVEQYWTEHKEEKENEKLLRKQKQDTDTSRRLVKRSATPGTPLVQAKRTKVVTSGSLFRTPVRAPKSAKTAGLTTGRPLGPLWAENTRAANAAGPSLVSVNSYSEFKHVLNDTNRASCRSTMTSQTTPKRFVCGPAQPRQLDKTIIRRRSQRIKNNLSKKHAKSVLSANSNLKSPKQTTAAKKLKMPFLF